MTRANYLNGRAALLRKVAETIDVWSIRNRILALADECVQLAKLVEMTTVEKQTDTSSARSSTPPRSQPRAKRESPRTRTAQQTRG